MKICQAPMDIAGQLSLSTLGLRSLGHHVTACFEVHPFKYAYLVPDRSLGQVGQSGLSRFLPRSKAALFLLGQYEVFHFHFLNSFLGEKLGFGDARLYRTMGQKVITEAWGSDVRIPSLTRQTNPYYVQPAYEDDQKAHDRMARWSEITSGHIICFDKTLFAGLQSHFDQIHYVPQRVKVGDQFSFPDPENPIPKLVHAPSDPLVKGTDVIRSTLERLQQKGVRFEYIELQGLSHAAVMETLESADLVIDQVRLGNQGVFALEAMSKGKPVICYLQEPPSDSPIINANPDTLEKVLEEWLLAPEERYKRGVASRDYVKRVHDHEVVAGQLIEIYKRLPRG